MDSSKESRTYYDILHVQQNAPLPIIKNAYRALMMSMKQHPDLGGDSAQAALINQAYETLKDEAKRAEYDQILAEQDISGTANSKEGHANQSQPRHQSSQAYHSGYEQNGARCPFCYKFHNGPRSELMDCSGCGSPLDPPPAGLNTGDAARSIERIPKNTDIQITDTLRAKPKVASLRDLSPQGLGFVLQDNLEPQQVVKIGCPLFEGLATIAYKRASENDGVFYGAQFLTLRFHSTSGNFISTRL